MTEDQIQAACFKWAHNTYCLKHHSPRLCIFAVPNGGTRNRIEAIKLKATGLLPGVSDLIGLFPSAISVYFELKTDVGIQSAVQLDFQSTVEALGFNYHLARTEEEFKSVWLSYINQ